MRRLAPIAFVLLASCSQHSSTSPTPTLSAQEVELTKAVKHYYEVFNQVRATNDWTLIESVSEKGGVDWSNVRAFALSQIDQHKASITTREIFSNWKLQITGSTATVYYDYQASGYDIDAQSKKPLENETTLPPHRDKMELRLHGATWFVFDRQQL